MSDLSKLPQAAAPCIPASLTPIDHHGRDAFEVRFGTATAEAVPTGSVSHATNGDEALYPDKSGTYTKCIKQKGFGVVDPTAFALFRTALGDGSFEAPGLLGLDRKLNGPLGAYALTLTGKDSQGYGAPLVPPAPAVASKEYAVELIELYWASLLRDVPFTAYHDNDVAKHAADELTAHKANYAGPLDAAGKVTPELLFRGGLKQGGKTYFAGEDVGPYLSQLCITPTNLGAVAIGQRLQTYAPGLDYMTDIYSWGAVRNGWSG